MWNVWTSSGLCSIMQPDGKYFQPVPVRFHKKQIFFVGVLSWWKYKFSYIWRDFNTIWHLLCHISGCRRSSCNWAPSSSFEMTPYNNASSAKSLIEDLILRLSHSCTLRNSWCHWRRAGTLAIASDWLFAVHKEGFKVIKQGTTDTILS